MRRNQFLSSQRLSIHKISLLGALMLVAVAAIACAGERGGGGDFDINVYQSGGVLAGSHTTFKDVLDQDKPVVLNFWAGLCPPCRAEMPALESAWQEYGNEVVMLGIDVGPLFGYGSFDDGQALIGELQVTYPAGNTDESGILEDFNLSGLPATFFMLPDGTITDDWPGAIASGPLSRRIDELIAAHAQGG